MENDQLCVTIESRRPGQDRDLPHRACRTLSRNAQTGQLMMTDILDRNGLSGDIVFVAAPQFFL